MQKREKILYRACAVFLSVLVILFALVAGVMIANSVADKNVRYTPDYERIDLAPILGFFVRLRRRAVRFERYGESLFRVGFGRHYKICKIL